MPVAPQPMAFTTFDVPIESWTEAPVKPEVAPEPIQRVSSHGSTLENSSLDQLSQKEGNDTTEDREPASKAPGKSGRPVVDRRPKQAELLQTLKEKLRFHFFKIDEKFSLERKRTDKYRTMLVRMLKRVLGEVVALIGIDSYAKSSKVDRYLPEFNKRFE